VPAVALPVMSDNISVKEYEALTAISDLLLNPLILGIASPDWRRTLLELALQYARADEALLRVSPCRVLPSCIQRVRRRRGSSAIPESTCDVQSLTHHLPAGFWTPLPSTSGRYPSFRASLRVGEIRIELDLKGVGTAAPSTRPARRGTAILPAEARSIANRLEHLGWSLQCWAVSTENLGFHPMGEMDLDAHASQSLLPAWVRGADGKIRSVNAAAESMGISADDPLGSPIVQRISIRPPWWVAPEPAPGSSIVEGPDGDRFRVFRRPGRPDLDGGDERLEDTLVVLAPLRNDLPTIGTLRRTFGLSEREGQVARLLARGYPTKGIARQLGVSWHTARGHVERVLRKLGVTSRAHVIHRIVHELPR
jgi:DNA-binding CsgD family transcriptional regulator